MFDESATDVSIERDAVAVAAGISQSPASPTVNRSEGSPSRGTFSVILAASILVHATIALELHVGQSEIAPKSIVSQVEIEIARPPPPPEPERPREPDTPPAPLPQASKPIAHPASPLRPPPIAASPPPSTLSGLPASDDGILPPAPPAPPSAITNAEAIVAPAPPPAGTPAPPAPLPVVEAKEGANYLKNPRPPYPRLALREGWEGKVLLRVRVLANGRVGGATVQRSAGHSVLDEAALDVVKGWTFVAARQGGQPVDGFVTVPFEFEIN